MIADFHSHVLPGVDDGSRDVEQSLEMLRMEAAQGITHVVATPHFYPRYDHPEEYFARRQQAYEALKAQLEPGSPQIVLGAEVHFFRGMSQSELLQRLCIGRTGHILVEMPAAPWPEEYYRELEAIAVQQGLTPIIAHLDRYIGPLRTHGIPQRLAQLPVLVQANGAFFCKAATAGLARKLLKEGRIHLLGSDCHDTTVRKPDLGPAMMRIGETLGRQALTNIHRCARQILEPEGGEEKTECVL